MNEEIKEQKVECEDTFLKISKFYKSVISGILIVAGLLGGTFAWAMSTEKVSTLQQEQIYNHESRISKVENKLDKIDNKLDIIIDRIKK